ncbi:hypothetical protein [Methylobacterium nonmethylotrophicum]|uniref:Uncharacterized protein n=1 Tax=Methylobacterium nonmethylotrophicum TaxID=1141884 RepID=A0A4Z0NEL0_9HYPH|nr:hypothetical protein [Methylobacterium nonmethylotrophicum]TGD92634.1 hypothetical protein EU555_34430 [Methylobacterium nonmethylotrophicum]
MNDNEGLNETEGFVENVLDDLIYEAAEDSNDGPLAPGPVLIEMAARALARMVLHYDFSPDETIKLAAGRFATILHEQVERLDARLPADLRLVE